MAFQNLPTLPSPNGAAGLVGVATGTFGNAQVAQSTALGMLAIANGYSGFLNSVAGGLTAPKIDPQFPTIATAPVPVTAPLPVLRDVTWLTPTDPGAFTGILDTTGITIPPFNVIPPVLNFGTSPVPDFGTSPDAPGINTNFAFPSLSLTLPAPPSLLSVNVVPFNGVTLPTFSATQPVLTAIAPNLTVYSPGPAYTSTLLTALETNLQQALTTAWTGLDPTQEAALWDRAREREFRSLADELARLDQMENFGFSLPPGVWLDARLKLQTEIQNTTAGLSRDIAIKQAELALENVVKARETCTQLEAKLIDYANQIEQRSFESAKYQTEANVSIYNAAVAAFTAQNEGYRAAAMVYDYQIKGALAVAEVYRTQIEAEKVKAEINHELVAMYAELLKGQELNVEIYKAQLGGIETQANIEKLKVEIFGEQIKAFTAKVGAYTGEVEAYKANAQAQTAVEQAYATQVSAYKTQVDAGITQINSRIETYKAQIQAYEARLHAYTAALQAMTEQARSAALYNTAQAEVYKAEITGLSSYNATLTQQWHAIADIAEKEAEVGVKAAEAQGQLYIATKNLAIEAAKTGAQVAGQLGAAALSTVHFSSSAAWSQQLSQSISDSTGVSMSNVGTDNDNHNQNS